MKVNIGSDVQLIARCCQHRAVTQANYIPDPCCLMGSLGHNELTLWSIMSHSVGNSHKSASPKPTTLEEDWKLFVDFSSILCLWFEIQGVGTYNFFDWDSNTDESAKWVSISSVMVCHLPSHCDWISADNIVNWTNDKSFNMIFQILPNVCLSVWCPSVRNGHCCWPNADRQMDNHSWSFSTNFKPSNYSCSRVLISKSILHGK